MKYAKVHLCGRLLNCYLWTVQKTCEEVQHFHKFSQLLWVLQGYGWRGSFNLNVENILRLTTDL